MRKYLRQPKRQGLPCSGSLAVYGVYKKRGSDAMDELGILPSCTGIVKHNCLAAYFKYENCSHSLCNAHILRKLIWVALNEHQAWAQQMHDLLLFEAKAAVDEAYEKKHPKNTQVLVHI
jgi:transposase